eukprot:6180068-Pleurochrysis_carterae.AAC.4
MDDKTNEREQDHQATTDRRDAYLLVSVSEAPSQTENFNITSAPTSGRGALAVNSSSGLVTAYDPKPNDSSKSPPNQKRDRRDKDDMEGVSAVPKPSVMDMAGTPDASSSRDARLLEVKDDAYSGFLARVRGSPDPRAMRASQSSRVEGGNKGHSESVLTVHGSSDLGMAGALDVSAPRDARLLEVKDERRILGPSGKGARIS